MSAFVLQIRFSTKLISRKHQHQPSVQKYSYNGSFQFNNIFSVDFFHYFIHFVKKYRIARQSQWGDQLQPCRDIEPNFLTTCTRLAYMFVEFLVMWSCLLNERKRSEICCFIKHIVLQCILLMDILPTPQIPVEENCLKLYV